MFGGRRGECTRGGGVAQETAWGGGGTHVLLALILTHAHASLSRRSTLIGATPISGRSVSFFHVLRNKKKGEDGIEIVGGEVSRVPLFR